MRASHDTQQHELLPEGLSRRGVQLKKQAGLANQGRLHRCTAESAVRTAESTKSNPRVRAEQAAGTLTQVLTHVEVATCLSLAQQ